MIISSLFKKSLLLISPLISAFLLVIGLRTALAHPSIAPSGPTKPPASRLIVQMITPTDLLLDSNNWCSSQPKPAGPEGSWYQIRVSNPTTATYQDLRLNLAIPNELKMDDNNRFLGSLAPGTSIDQFIFIDYNALRRQAGCSVNDPPVSYSQPFQAVISSPKMDGQNVLAGNFTAKGISSANVGGTFVSSSLPPAVTVGQILSMTVVYGFGNNSSNTPLWMQPTGNSSFVDECFRLVGTQVLESQVAGVNNGATNQIYFPTATTDNNDIIKTRYFFQVVCSKGGGTTTAPFATITSGGRIKYNLSSYAGTGGGGSGGGIIVAPSPVSNVLTLDLSVSPAVLNYGGVATYRTRLTNTADVPILVEAISGTLQTGINFDATSPGSQVNPSNSSVSPDLGSPGPLQWYGYPYVTFTVPPSGSLAAGVPGSLELIYTAQITRTAGAYTTSAIARVGKESTNSDTAQVLVTNSPTAITLEDFSASSGENGVELIWVTGTEIDTLGFHVYRSTSPAGEYQLVNTSPIWVADPGSSEGHGYGFLDASAQPGMVYYYILEEIDLHDVRTRYGPVLVTTPPGPQQPWMYLPFVLVR